MKKPGRPRYQPVLPEGKFTFTTFADLNGVDLETGKGAICSALTLRKWLAKDAERGNQSMVVRLDEVATIESKEGVGLARIYYIRRNSPSKSVQGGS